MLTLESNLSPTQSRTREPKQHSGDFETVLPDESGDVVDAKFFYTYIQRANEKVIISLVVKTDAKSAYIVEDAKEALREREGKNTEFDCKVTLIH